MNKTRIKNWLYNYWFYAFPIGFALLAAAIMVYEMNWGPWAFSDSAAYISAARNLVAGHGLSVSKPSGNFSPLTLHQPLYPLILSFFLLFDIHPFTTTTVINIFSFSLGMLILGVGIYYFTKSKILTVAIPAVLIVTPAWIDNFSGAMSEPLFLFLTIAAFFGLLLYLETGRFWLILLSGFLAGLSLLTRYIGMVNIFLGFLLLLLFAAGKWKSRVKYLLAYAGSVLIPTLIWTIAASQPASSSRQIVLPIDLTQRLQGFFLEFQQTIIGWLPIPNQRPLSAGLQSTLLPGVALLLIGIIIYLLWRLLRTTSPARRSALMVPLAAALFCVSYSLFMLAASFFSSLPPDINSRTLIPLLPFAWIALASALVLLPSSKKMVWGASVILVIYAAYAVNTWYPISKELLYDRRHNGLGYTARYFQESTILKAARSLPLDAPWIANDPALYLLYLNKFPYDLSDIYGRFDQEETLQFGLGDTKLDGLFQYEGAYLLLHQPQFERDLRSRYGDIAVKKVEQFTCGLAAVDDSDDGQIYFWVPPDR